MDKNIAVKKEKLYQDPDDYTLKDSIMTDESKVRVLFRSQDNGRVEAELMGIARRH